MVTLEVTRNPFQVRITRSATFSDRLLVDVHYAGPPHFLVECAPVLATSYLRNLADLIDAACTVHRLADGVRRNDADLSG